MDTPTVAYPPTPNTRELRALELYRDRGREIVLVDADTYEVPSCSGRVPYVVDLRDESCTCRDFEIRRENCKHILAASVKRAKKRGATARHLAGLQDRARHEDLDPVVRLELLDEIRGLRRKLGL